MRRLAFPFTCALVLIASAAGSASAQVGCTPQRPAANRASPYDSVAFTISGKRAVVCYGRPSSKGRTMIGGSAVPYGKLWRTGANEPTIIHLPVAARIAGVKVPAGSYSLYTIPGETEWHVIVNKSISQWGHESAYSAKVKAEEVGHGTAKVVKPARPVETFTITAPKATGGADLILEWENSRVSIPVRVETGK